jgi:hypothetical protein
MTTFDFEAVAMSEYALMSSKKINMIVSKFPVNPAPPGIRGFFESPLPAPLGAGR